MKRRFFDGLEGTRRGREETEKEKQKRPRDRNSREKRLHRRKGHEKPTRKKEETEIERQKRSIENVTVIGRAGDPRGGEHRVFDLRGGDDQHGYSIEV